MASFQTMKNNVQNITPCFQLAAILFKLITTIYWEAIERVGMGTAGIHCAIAEATALTVLAARAKQIYSFAQDQPSVIKPVIIQPASYNRQPVNVQLFRPSNSLNHTVSSKDHSIKL